MIQNKIKIIIITGAVGAGKTTFLKNTILYLKKYWRIDGFLSLPYDRGFNNENPNWAKSYNLELCSDKTTYQWAQRDEERNSFVFNKNTIEEVSNRIIKNKGHDLIILDDLGMLEVAGDGFHQLLSKLLLDDLSVIILSVKKMALNSFVTKYFKNYSPIIINIQELSIEESHKIIKKELLAVDAEKIGIYATITGAMEITLGSVLHASRIPFKGHFLALLQNFLLIIFGKDLKGRGIIWVVFISSALKSFSFAGGKLKPMFYIFMQGMFFILPTYIIGWNILSIILGSIFMGMSTIFLSLGMDYIQFGRSIIDAYINGFKEVSLFFGLGNWTFQSLVLAAIILKATLALILSITAYYLNFSFLISKWQLKLDKLMGPLSSPSPNPTHEISCSNISQNQKNTINTPTWKQSFIGAFKDISLMRFFIPFIFFSLIIYFFAKLTASSFAIVVIRGLVLSWFGFVLARRINYPFIIEFLKKRNLEHVAISLENSLNKILLLIRTDELKKHNKKGREYESK
ncbi:MAG: hypothetical protein HQK49_21715 [Oligoflexia bacterium]|nr:hypothetical protein [Oligoflexia bacterium]